MNSTTIFQEVTIRVAYETYGGESKALDAVLDAIEESAPIELKVLDYSARELRLVPTEEA